MYILEISSLLSRLSLRKVTYLFVYILMCVLFISSAFEILYRFQLIDTYSPELRGYNSPKDLTSSDGRPTMLVMGDSFTAGNETYPSILKSKLPAYRVINAAISGTGIIEATTIAPKRFRQFTPTVFIYQIYVGNDLFNITHPVNWTTISFVRNIYWATSNYFRSLSYINYRLGQQFATSHEIISGRKQSLPQATDLSFNVEPDIFSPNAYAARPKITLLADPWQLDKDIRVTDEREKDYDFFLRKLTRLISGSGRDQCQTYILVIPHCCQIHAKYLENFKRLGARFNNEDDIQKTEYPFIKKLRLAVAPMSGVRVLNPIGYLRRQEMLGEPMYFQNDDHLTPAGQNAIANFLFKELIEGLPSSERAGSGLDIGHPPSNSGSSH